MPPVCFYFLFQLSPTFPLFFSVSRDTVPFFVHLKYIRAKFISHMRVRESRAHIWNTRWQWDRNISDRRTKNPRQQTSSFFLRSAKRRTVAQPFRRKFSTTVNFESEHSERIRGYFQGEILIDIKERKVVCTIPSFRVRKPVSFSTVFWHSASAATTFVRNFQTRKIDLKVQALFVPELKLFYEHYTFATSFWNRPLQVFPMASRQSFESRDRYAQLHVQIVQVITCQQYISESFLCYDRRLSRK